MAKINFIKGQRPTPSKSFDGVYGNGGEVAEKIKSRLAKGAFELPMEMIVYVPSTKDGNVIISKSDFQARIKSVRTYLATKFGGFSSNPTDGGYMSNEDKGLIEEDVVKVTAFATKEALEENLDALLKKIQSWCRAWSQESIGFEFEGDLFYISATSKFMKGGVAGDIYSIKDPEQFKQMITVYNNIAEKFDDVHGYYLDHTDKSVVFLTTPNISDNGKDKIFRYVESMTSKGFSIFDWQKTLGSGNLDWGTERGSRVKEYGSMRKSNSQWFKMYLKDVVKYAGGGEAEDEDNRTMIIRQAKEVAHHVEELNEILSKQPDIDAWVVAKMQDVTTQLSEVTHYLDSRVGFRFGGENIQAVQDSMLAKGAKLKSGKITLSKLKSMIEEYNAEGRNFELLGAYNQLELWGNDYRLETGSKEDIYRALIRYRYNPKYADGAELPDMDSMTDEEIITFANTMSFYDRMNEGIEEEFTDVEDAKEYLRMMEE